MASFREAPPPTPWITLVVCDPPRVETAPMFGEDALLGRDTCTGSLSPGADQEFNGTQKEERSCSLEANSSRAFCVSSRAVSVALVPRLSRLHQKTKTKNKVNFSNFACACGECGDVDRICLF